MTKQELYEKIINRIESKVSGFFCDRPYLHQRAIRLLQEDNVDLIIDIEDFSRYPQEVHAFVLQATQEVMRHPVRFATVLTDIRVDSIAIISKENSVDPNELGLLIVKKE